MKKLLLLLFFLPSITLASPVLNNWLIWNGTNWVNTSTTTLGLMTSLTGKTTDDLTQGSTNKYANTTKEDNGQTAFGWGNHASAGYLTNLLGGLNAILGNASTTNLTIGTAGYLTGVTSSFLATNQQEKIIATTTPTGGTETLYINASSTIPRTNLANLFIVPQHIGTTTQSTARLEVNNQDPAAVNGGLRIISKGTSGADYELRMDSPNPDVEFVESDQVTPAGKYEIDVDGDQLRINGRNQADNSFDSFAVFQREDNFNHGQIGLFTGFGTGYSRLDLVGTSTDDFFGITDKIANLTSGGNGNILKIKSNGNLGVGTSSPSNRLEVRGSGYFTGNLWGANITATGTLTLKPLATPNGSFLAVNASGVVIATSTPAVGGGGTVTSVDMSVPTGLTIGGNPVTGAGTLALSLTSGYLIPTTASSTKYDQFYNIPSTRISAGTNLGWSGNTLNFSGTASNWKYTTALTPTTTVAVSLPSTLTVVTTSTLATTTTTSLTVDNGSTSGTTTVSFGTTGKPFCAKYMSSDGSTWIYQYFTAAAGIVTTTVSCQ